MRISIKFDFFKPILYVGECFSSSNIVDEDCSDRTSVVGSGDGTEVFLSGSIPNLKFYIFVLNMGGFSSKLDADGDIMGVSGFVLDELQDNAGFAHTRVADDDELIKVMVRIHYRK